MAVLSMLNVWMYQSGVCIPKHRCVNHYLCHYCKIIWNVHVVDGLQKGNRDKIEKETWCDMALWAHWYIIAHIIYIIDNILHFKFWFGSFHSDKFLSETRGSLDRTLSSLPVLCKHVRWFCYVVNVVGYKTLGLSAGLHLAETGPGKVLARDILEKISIGQERSDALLVNLSQTYTSLVMGLNKKCGGKAPPKSRVFPDLR